MTETPSARVEIQTAHALVKDLFTPVPWRYWRELAVAGLASWAVAAVAIGAAEPVVTAVAIVVAALLWHRATVMVHELTHQRRAEIPGFHLAWNLVIGVAWLFPSVMYERVHDGHHRKTTYGTANDPEYLRMAGRPWLIAAYLATGLLLFPILLIRFLVLAPVSWAVPPLRRFVLGTLSSYSINAWFVRRMTRAERRRTLVWELVILAVWLPAVGLTVAGVVSWWWLVCWYAIHTATTLVNRLRMLTAHHFASDGSPTDHLGQFTDSIDHPAGPWAELWAPLGLRYHALHHLFPTLPFHSMAEAYRRLTAHLPADAFYRRSTTRGYLRAFWGVLMGRAVAPTIAADRAPETSENRTAMRSPPGT